MKKVIAIAVTVCVFQILAWLAIEHDVDTLLIPPEAVLPDGSRYYGELLDGRFHGKGRLLWADGSRYEGEFFQGLMSGKGELHTASGDTYKGEFKDGMMSGEGEFRTPAGSVYTGAFLNNLPHGQGVLKRHDGAEYTGEFAAWEFHGKGTYTSEGQEYSGDFVAGEFTGTGTYKDKEGNTYEGGFRDWEFHGAGVYTTAEGGIHRGNFEEGALNGKGSYEHKDGDRYEGEFKDGLYHGTGVFTSKNGDRYTGEFGYGQFHGKGEVVFAEPVDGMEKQSGEWEYGEFKDPDAEQKATLLRGLMEQALYSQNKLLEDAAQQLAPGTPDTIDLYFVGVASYGMQNVFLKELQYIRELFDSRFGTAGRSAVLINNTQTMHETALATRISLERTLQAVAAKMNPEEDILFLYLTSHGSSDHTLSFGHPGIKLPDLSPADFATMLQPLPVKWKVIVVSACYAGGFIEPLKHENTLIMTAASAERQSFGCSDTSEMTWFAKAYFRESLPQAASFEQAFENARKLIAEWELKEVEKGGEHSEPQISAGKAVVEQLQKWWQSLPAPLKDSPVEPPAKK